MCWFGAERIRSFRQRAEYHVEGIAELTLEAQTPGRPGTTGRMLQVVVGALNRRKFR